MPSVFTNDIKLNSETAKTLVNPFYYVTFTNHNYSRKEASQNVLLNLTLMLYLNNTDGSHKGYITEYTSDSV